MTETIEVEVVDNQETVVTYVNAVHIAQESEIKTSRFEARCLGQAVNGRIDNYTSALENIGLKDSSTASLLFNAKICGVGQEKLFNLLPFDIYNDFTVSRNGAATYVANDRLIKKALANVPRIDWTDADNPALLVEPQATNLVPTSASGTYGGTIPTSEILEAAPDGTNEAVRPVVGTTSNRYQEIISGGTYPTGQKLTYSWYRKRISTPSLDDTQIGDLNIQAPVNLTTEQAVQISSNIFGFDRFSSTVEIIDGSLQSTFRAYFGFVIGVGNSSVAYWGHQYETGTTASSYIPTDGSAATRFENFEITVVPPAGVESITETINGIEQTPIVVIPALYTVPFGKINKIEME